MIRSLRYVGGWQYWLTAGNGGTDWQVRVLCASNGDTSQFTVPGELSETEAHHEGWVLFLREKEDGSSGE